MGRVYTDFRSLSNRKGGHGDHGERGEHGGRKEEGGRRVGTWGVFTPETRGVKNHTTMKTMGTMGGERNYRWCG
jgi:hypothetical protein